MSTILQDDNKQHMDSSYRSKVLEILERLSLLLPVSRDKIISLISNEYPDRRIGAELLEIYTSALRSVNNSELYKLVSNIPVEPSNLYKELKYISNEAVILAIAIIFARNVSLDTEENISRILKAVYHVRSTRLSIDGSTLKLAGFKLNPIFADVLTQTLYDILDGKVTTTQEQETRAIELLQQRINQL